MDYSLFIHLLPVLGVVLNVSGINTPFNLVLYNTGINTAMAIYYWGIFLVLLIIPG